MKVELHLVRRCGIKIPAREAGGIPALVGEMEMSNRWVSETRALPALELTTCGVTNGTGVLAVLYEPKIVALSSNWIRFTGFELVRQGENKQLVVQDWRCYVLP